ncbi:hypothetical protein [Sphingorhabdus lutea]|nr:hypothetical protein [Sphingorhabdus lutea]
MVDKMLTNFDFNQRMLILAMAIGMVVGALSMLIPVYWLEIVTGSLGISEIIPATAAPLGDKARALIAFGFGVLAIAASFIFLSRFNIGRQVKSNISDKNAPDKAQVEEKVVSQEYAPNAAIEADILTRPKADLSTDSPAQSPTAWGNVKKLFSGINLPKMKLPNFNMPKWGRQNEEDIYEIQDLPPRMRSIEAGGEKKRAPIAASRDLSGVSLVDNISDMPDSPLIKKFNLSEPKQEVAVEIYEDLPPVQHEEAVQHEVAMQHEEAMQHEQLPQEAKPQDKGGDSMDNLAKNLEEILAKRAALRAEIAAMAQPVIEPKSEIVSEIDSETVPESSAESAESMVDAFVHKNDPQPPHFLTEKIISDDVMDEQDYRPKLSVIKGLETPMTKPAHDQSVDMSSDLPNDRALLSALHTLHRMKAQGQE